VKITDKIADLMIELSLHEPFERVDELVARDEVSLVSVLRLFNKTNNLSSRSVLTEILKDSGYAWYEPIGDLAQDTSSGSEHNNQLDALIAIPAANTYLH
jgi:hypothetical protein